MNAKKLLPVIFVSLEKAKGLHNKLKTIFWSN